MFRLFTQQLRNISRNAIIHSKVGAAVSENALKELVEVNKVLVGWSEKLNSAGVGDIDFNLKCLVAHVLKQKFNTVPDDYNNVHFNRSQVADFNRLCEARCARMPLQHIIGEWDFMDLTLKTAPTVFIPRPETEEFVHKVIQVIRPEKQVKMLEIGCGTGAMSLAILHALPQVTSDAIDRSKTAAALAWQNAKMLHLHDRFKVYNHTMKEDNYLPQQLKGQQYDLLIANPPYVKTSEFQYLQPEVVIYENWNALDGGPDGLRVARLVIDAACVALRKGGKLWLELGNEHPPLVKTIIMLKYEGRLRYIADYTDQYNRDRFVEIEKI